jgi:DNA-binding NarL/FixJ family response regulator
MVGIAIVENDSRHLNKLRKWIDEHPDFTCTITESRIGKFFERLELAHPPDILIMDLFNRHQPNLDHLKKLKILMPLTKFMIYTEKIGDDYLLQAFRMGINAVQLHTENVAFFKTLQRLARGQDFIDPTLSNNIISLFRSEHALENPAEAQLKQFMGLLNNRELQVVRGLSKGKQYKEIATDLYISINTVRHYVKSIYKKFNVNNKVQLLKKLQAMPVTAPY